ncbi:hypothetical protein NDU88_002692 [Pleurodeles waltl]|uniref:Uncharacterized protein n=1 Tax=Pleurodeles waltl TaxID=8319 RepID=A0AAV7NNW4_PLEWA|nr:hypothetical protein NDU88_002692 [Pleurodeles waltl]
MEAQCSLALKRFHVAAPHGGPKDLLRQRGDLEYHLFGPLPKPLVCSRREAIIKVAGLGVIGICWAQRETRHIRVSLK